jgi:hypothetical protein
MSDRGKDRLAKWTQRLAGVHGDEDATRKVVDEIGTEAVRLRREGDAMAHLYSGLTNLVGRKPRA